MATKTTTPKTKNAVKAGTKGAASRKKTTTPLGNTRAIDDNSFAAPKRKPKPAAEVVSFQQALEEAGQTIEDLRVPAEADRPTRPAGSSNLATTIRAHRGQYHVALAPNGKKTQNCGDAVAAALLRIPLASMKAFVGTKLPGLEYDRLNPGHQRMCYGNRIRAWAKQGDQDTLLWLETAQERPSEEAANPQPESDLDNDEQGQWYDTSAE